MSSLLESGLGIVRKPLPLVIAVSLVIALGSMVAGCVPHYAIRPLNGGPAGQAAAAGLQLYADPSAWDGEPSDLPEELTPIAVRIVNTSRFDVAVNYGEFELVDQSGFRYAMLHPFATNSATPPSGSAPAVTPPPSGGASGAPPAGQTAPPPATEPAEPPPPPAGDDVPSTEPSRGSPQPPPDAEPSPEAPETEQPSGYKLDSRGGAFGRQGRGGGQSLCSKPPGLRQHETDLQLGHTSSSGTSSSGDSVAQVTTEERGQVLLARRVVRRRGGFRGGGFRGGSVRVYRSGPYRGRSFYVYPRGRYYRRGYAVYPRWRYVAPWPIYAGPVYPYDPYYHTYVHVWDGPQYSTPSMDVRRLALPEGVIKAGGEVSGFVYFQNAMSRSERLELIWHARSASTGQELATLRIPFVITRM